MYSEYYNAEAQIGIKADENGVLSWYNTDTGEKRSLKEWDAIPYEYDDVDPISKNDLKVMIDNPYGWYYAYPDKVFDGIYETTLGGGMYAATNRVKSLYDFIDEDKMIGVFDSSTDPLTYQIITKIGVGTTKHGNSYIIQTEETNIFTIIDSYRIANKKTAYYLQYDNDKLFYDGNGNYTWVSDVTVNLEDDKSEINSITITTVDGEELKAYQRPLTIEEMYSEYYNAEAQIGIKADENGVLSWYNTDTGEKLNIYASEKVSQDIETNDNAIIVIDGKSYYAYPDKHQGSYTTETNVDDSSLIKPEDNESFYYQIPTPEESSVDIIIYRGDDDFQYRTYDTSTLSEPKTFSKLVKIIGSKKGTSNLNTIYYMKTENNIIIEYNETNNNYNYLDDDIFIGEQYDKNISKIYVYNKHNTALGYNEYIVNNIIIYDRTCMPNYNMMQYDYYNKLNSVYVKTDNDGVLSWYNASDDAKMSILDWEYIEYDTVGYTVQFDENKEGLRVHRGYSDIFYLDPSYNNRAYKYNGSYTNSLFKHITNIAKFYRWISYSNSNKIGSFIKDQPTQFRVFTIMDYKDGKICGLPYTMTGGSSVNTLQMYMRFIGWDRNSNINVTCYTAKYLVSSANIELTAYILFLHNISEKTDTYLVVDYLTVSNGTIGITYYDINGKAQYEEHTALQLVAY